MASGLGFAVRHNRPCDVLGEKRMHVVSLLRGELPVPPVSAVDAVPQRQQVEYQQAYDDQERNEHGITVLSLRLRIERSRRRNREIANELPTFCLPSNLRLRYTGYDNQSSGMSGDFEK